MATATKKATAVKSTGKSTAMVPWKERFAAAAVKAVEQEKNVGVGGISVRFGRGTIEIGDQPVTGGKLECVIIASCGFNAYYKDTYDASNVQPPDCYAFAIIGGDPDMAPHPECAMPQAKLCADCKHNVFGSAENGRGKACGNKRKLAIITAKDAKDPKVIFNAELAMAMVSPTNLKHYAGYVKMLADDHGRPPWSVVTQIQSFDDKKNQIRLEFSLVDTIEDDDTLSALEKRNLKGQELLQQPYAPPIERAAAKPTRKASTKFAGKNR